jgi:hypothetical protein
MIFDVSEGKIGGLELFLYLPVLSKHSASKGRPMLFPLHLRGFSLIQKPLGLSQGLILPLGLPCEFVFGAIPSVFCSKFDTCPERSRRIECSMFCFQSARIVPLWGIKGIF